MEQSQVYSLIPSSINKKSRFSEILTFPRLATAWVVG